MHYLHFLYFHFKQCFKPIQKWGRSVCLKAPKWRKDKNLKEWGGGGVGCGVSHGVFFSIVHGFFTQIPQSKMLRDQGPADVENYSFKNGHDSLPEEISVCHKNHEFSPAPMKGHDIYARR